MLLAFLVSIFLATSSPATLTLPPALLVVDSQALWMDSLSQCESLGSTTIKILDTNHYYSYGKYQYQMGTWLPYSKLFGTTKENIYDGSLQDTVTRHILDTDGWKGYWNVCGALVTKNHGAYPPPAVSPS